MFHYSPSEEPPSARIMLIQVAKSHYSPAEFGSVTAKVIRVAMRDDMTGAHPRYFDGAKATGFRNATWQNNSKGAMFVEDLTIHAQFDVRSEAKPYGEQLVFDLHRPDARHVALMYETFKKLNKKLKEQEEVYGHVQNVADLILRTANALGIRQFAKFRTGDTSLDSQLNLFNAANVGYEIDDMVRKVRAG